MKRADWRRWLLAVAVLLGLASSGCTSMGAWKWQVQREKISKDFDNYVGMGPEWP
ncbi:MAG: hypothetical protein AAB215_08210 [Planctomycetota bacterium]